MGYITNLNHYLKSPALAGEMLKGNLFLAILFIAAINPILDEVFFRGIIFNELKNNVPIVIAIIIQSFIYSVFYWSIFGVAFLDGILYAIIYLWFKTIWSPIIAHMMTIIFNYLHFFPFVFRKLSLYYYGIPLLVLVLAMFSIFIYLILKNKDKILRFE